MSDIAKKLGVDTSTVSLALRDSPKVSVAMREKVRATAAEMGYQVNPYVSALMSTRRSGKDPKKPPVIALITAGESPDGWKTSYNPKEFVKGCEEVAQGLGIRLEHFWIGDEKMSGRRLNEIIYARGIRGAVLLEFGLWREKLKISWQNIATVSYGICEGDAVSDWVTANQHRNMEIILSRLKEQQYKRIGFAMETSYAYSNYNPWLTIFLMEQYSNPGLEHLEPWVDPEPSYESFAGWFKKNRPGVIICVRPPIVSEWIGRMGLRVPEDVGLVTIGTAEAGGDFSGIFEKSRTVGKYALEMLFERIHRNEFGKLESPHHITVSGEWNQGKTLRPFK